MFPVRFSGPCPARSTVHRSVHPKLQGPELSGPGERPVVYIDPGPRMEWLLDMHMRTIEVSRFLTCFLGFSYVYVYVYVHAYMCIYAQ